MIEAAVVRLINVNGEPIGLLEIEKALAIAAGEGLDLVEVAANADPPVCRIMDYGHFKYQRSKRQNETKKHQKTIQLKEIKFRPKTEDHDFQFKLKHGINFLQEGHKVKVTVVFRGRELHYQDNGRRLMDRFMEGVGERAVVENPLHMEGRFLSVVLSPNKGFKASEIAKSANAAKEAKASALKAKVSVSSKTRSALEESAARTTTKGVTGTVNNVKEEA